VTEPWPVGVEAGPFMSVSTPILTKSSDTCAMAAGEAEIAANAASTARNDGVVDGDDGVLANIMLPPLENGLSRHCSFGGSRAPMVALATIPAAASNGSKAQAAKRIWPAGAAS
jgi:hypothetical protein